MNDAAQQVVIANPTGTPAVRMAAPMFSTPCDTAIIEQFAQAFVETSSWGAAYRKTFDIAGMKDRALWNRAYEFAQRHDVRQAIATLLDDARKKTIISVSQLLNHLANIATANPAALTWVAVHNCRHCWGIDGAYQWRDYDEWAQAASSKFAEAVNSSPATASSTRLPTDEGGYGYNLHRAPNPDCQGCGGAGHRITHIRDRDAMGERELALFKGVKQKADGSIEVLMHDQLKAAEMVGRILGAFNDKLSIIPPARVAELPAGTKPADVQAAYLALVGS